MSLNKSRFGKNLNLIYSNEFEVKNTNDAQNFASDLDFRVEIDNGGRLKAKIYDKRDDFTLPRHHELVECYETSVSQITILLVVYLFPFS